jgi:glycosyltransferase involved in cell wall biosynthesis
MNTTATISVITATLNARQSIGFLAADLVSQTDQDFFWIVVDGGSIDDTLAQLPAALMDRITVIQEPDFGIYDAINKGLRECKTEYYLVIGADDRLDAGAIKEFRRLARDSSADIIAASVKDGANVAAVGRGKPWLRGQSAYLSHHSVGALIRRRLHNSFGFYSNRYPIAADQFFVKHAIQGGASVHYAPDFVSGEFGRGGVSSVQFAATLFEFTLVQLRTEKNKNLQLLIFVSRLLRHWKKIVG